MCFYLRNFAVGSFSRCAGFSFGPFAFLKCGLIFNSFYRTLAFSRSRSGSGNGWALRCLSRDFSFASAFLWNIFKAAWFPRTTFHSCLDSHSSVFFRAGQYSFRFYWRTQQSRGFSWASLNSRSIRQATWLSWTGLNSNVSVDFGFLLRTCGIISSSITHLSFGRTLIGTKNIFSL